MRVKYWIHFLIITAMVGTVLGCPLLPVDMLDDPADAGGGNYQGYPVIADPDEIEGCIENGEYLAIPRFVVSQVQDAQAYRLQVATDVEFASVVYDEDVFVGNVMDADNLEGSLTKSLDERYWRACAKAGDTWGAWSEARSFVYMHPNTVYFDAQGGTEPAPEWKAVVEGQPYGVLPVVSKPGYVFDGWWTGVGGTGSVVTTASVVGNSEGYIVYAKWLPPHTVSFESNGGSALANIEYVGHGTKISAPTAPTKSGYVFDGWYKESGLSTLWNFSTDTVVADVTLYAKWFGPVTVKGFGPAGGYVFYDKGSYSDGWRYLEAAPASTELSKVWGGYGTSVDGTSTGIGTGESNTSKIVAKLGNGDYAAKACADLVVTKNGIVYDDWFLPSIDELNQIHQMLYLNNLGGYSGDYWSSSEYSPTNAWRNYFPQGVASANHWSYKDFNWFVRAVRAF